jgi:hypothetical protein
VSDLKPLVMLVVTLLLSVPGATQSSAAGRSFEDCQALLLSRDVPLKKSGRVSQRYLRYKTAGTAKNPKGIIARCMAGTG